MMSDLVLFCDLHKSVKEGVWGHEIYIEIKFSKHAHLLVYYLLFIVSIVAHVYVIFY